MYPLCGATQQRNFAVIADDIGRCRRRTDRL